MERKKEPKRDAAGRLIGRRIYNKGTTGRKKRKEEDKAIPILVYYSGSKIKDFGGMDLVRDAVREFLKNTLK